MMTSAIIEPSETHSPTLEMRGVSKNFDATQALDNVALSLYPGEVHVLLGENGAGKSTLIKIMTGIHQPDHGQILLDGKPIQIDNTAQAQRFGIAAIYQEPLVFPDLNVAENIFISHQGRGAVVNWPQMYKDAEAILAQLGVPLNVRLQARGLTLAEQQTVEIAKAISLKVRVLIMDEPTASLSAHEVTRLFDLIKKLRAQGVAILFISHRMEEVFQIADRITIFRDGKLISSAPASEVTPDTAIRDMVGREVSSFFHREVAQRGPVLLSVRNLSHEDVFSDISFDLHRGEVLGFAGLVGSGRTDVALSLFGIAPATSGEIIFDGNPVHIRSPQQAMALGIAYLTEDRRGQGLIMPMSIATNVTLPKLRHYLNRFGLVRSKDENEAAEGYRSRLSIRTPSIHLAASKLSGGNQQKVVVGKWLNMNPHLLILDEPTRGIDVGAKAEIHAIIGQLAAQNIAILLISSDLPEVLGMSDRILVMREGRQMGIFSHDEATQEQILSAAMGQAVSTENTRALAE
jgi:rhamnose transport system ATP-binding protein